MKNLSDDFRAAANDYLFLLNRSYPQKALIKLIGDRYRLSGTERSMLYRGICASEHAQQRIGKLAEPALINPQPLSIDTYNALITIGSYLNGNTVFISNDHLLRDASEIHGKVFRTELLQRSLDLLFGFLMHYRPSTLRFYLDSPVSHSGRLCVQINETLAAKGLTGVAETHRSPDFLLKYQREGIIATSDSSIIDKTQLPVLDLPHHILRHHFKPEFYDLRGFV